MKDIIEFWIIKWSGIPLFKYPRTDSSKSSLTSSFFSALQAFAATVITGDREKPLNMISVGEFNYTFTSDLNYELYFIIKSKIKTKLKNAKTYLKELSKKFIEKFNFELSNFENEITIFEEFEQDFLNYLTPYEKVKNMF